MLPTPMSQRIPAMTEKSIPDERLKLLVSSNGISSPWVRSICCDALPILCILPQLTLISVVCLDGKIDSSPMSITSGSTSSPARTIPSSEPKGSSISGMLLKEGKIIEEGRSTYWVKLTGTEPPSQVSKEG